MSLKSSATEISIRLALRFGEAREIQIVLQTFNIICTFGSGKLGVFGNSDRYSQNLVTPTFLLFGVKPAAESQLRLLKAFDAFHARNLHQTSA